MEAGKSKICSVGWQPGGPEKLMFQFQSKAQWAGDPGELLVQMQSEGSLQDSILLTETGFFVLSKPSTD